MSRVPVRHPVFFAIITSAFLLGRGSDRPAYAAEMRFHRPSETVIRETARKILEDPQFTPRKSFRQMLYEWFVNKFKNTRFPRLPDQLANILLWILIAWCVLALVAILGHLVWTLVVLLRNRAAPLPAGGSLTLLNAGQHLTYEELMAQITQLAARGEFRQAAALLMIALFKYLDRAGLIRYHESKTNGDYIREFPHDREERAELRQLALAFDETVYGGKTCDLQTYRQLYGIFERIQTHVTHQP